MVGLTCYFHSCSNNLLAQTNFTSNCLESCGKKILSSSHHYYMNLMVDQSLGNLREKKNLICSSVLPLHLSLTLKKFVFTVLLRIDGIFLVKLCYHKNVLCIFWVLIIALFMAHWCILILKGKLCLQHQPKQC